jgi:molybdopterin-binding protein
VYQTSLVSHPEGVNLRAHSVLRELSYWMPGNDGLTQRHGVGYKPSMANTTRPSRLLSPRDAAKILGISYPTLKQWIYKKKLHTVTTAGGHHRIPESELDEFLHLHSERLPVEQRRPNFRQISGRNQLAGRVTEIKVEGLIAQIGLSIGGQKITSIITADAVREMRLKVGDKAAALIKSTEVMIVRI